MGADKTQPSYPRRLLGWRKRFLDTLHVARITGPPALRKSNAAYRRPSHRLAGIASANIACVRIGIGRAAVLSLSGGRRKHGVCVGLSARSLLRDVGPPARMASVVTNLSVASRDFVTCVGPRILT